MQNQLLSCTNFTAWNRAKPVLQLNNVKIMLTLTLPEIFGIQPKTSSIIYLPFSLLQPDGTIQVSHQTLNVNFLLKLSLSIST